MTPQAVLATVTVHWSLHGGMSNGPNIADGGEDDPYVFYVLSEDRRGDLQYYPVDTVYQGNRSK